MTNEPRVAERPPTPYVGVTRTVTMATIAEIADQIPRVIESAVALGLEPAGAPFLRYDVIDMARELVVEAGIPLAHPAPPGTPLGDLEAGALPGGRYATVVHVGHPATLADATAALLRWAADGGLAFDVLTDERGDVWGCRLESYLTDPRDEPDMSRWETELAFRLAGDPA
ncbi:GyrI-like domain-containing protein [Luteimicrobium sp. NPDC057192]|uniref:GyrI-like domain-containing protein n=1 Tax=Luteimicrobium sp. NPDC057192 TaxID=3346042 RepID=UPI00362A9D4D